MTHSYVWSQSFTCAPQTLVSQNAMIALLPIISKWHDPFTYVPWLIHMCEVTHLYVYHRLWYGVSTISRLLKKQVSFAKEPYKRVKIPPKRPIILRSLLIVATPYYQTHHRLWYHQTQWPIKDGGETPSCMRHDSSICVPGFMHVCITRQYFWDSNGQLAHLRFQYDRSAHDATIIAGHVRTDWATIDKQSAHTGIKHSSHPDLNTWKRTVSLVQQTFRHGFKSFISRWCNQEDFSITCRFIFASPNVVTCRSFAKVSGMDTFALRANTYQGCCTQLVM